MFANCLASKLPCQLPACFAGLSCRVWGPKVTPWASWQAGVAQQQPLAFSLLFSSVASLLGSAGQSNYAAANSALDAAAAADRGMGVSTQSIRWGAWAGELHVQHSAVNAAWPAVQLACFGIQNHLHTYGGVLILIIRETRGGWAFLGHHGDHDTCSGPCLTTWPC